MQIKSFYKLNNKNIFKSKLIQKPIKIFDINSFDNIKICFRITNDYLDNTNVSYGIYYMGCIVWV